MKELPYRLCQDLPEAWGELDTLLRRDWAVRVLDAWAQTQSGVPSPRKLINGRWGCLDFVGDTPAAARHAAALAVWPTLSAEVRAEIGECP